MGYDGETTMNETTVVPLREATLLPGQPNRPVIEMLERFIERAKRGEIAAVALVIVTPAGGTTHAWEIGDSTWPPIVGAVSMLHHAMVADIHD